MVENICYFDIVVGFLIIMLGLKGLLDGFIKEFFGLVGIIGGIYLGSHYGYEMALLISDKIYKIKNEAALSFIGFLVILGGFWFLMVLLSKLFMKLTKASGLGILDKLSGFIFGGAKIFLIFAVILFAISNIEITKSVVEKYTKNSILYPVLIKSGSYIIKLSPSDVTQQIASKTKEIELKSTKAIEKNIEEKINKTIEKNIQKKIEKEIKKSIPNLEKNLTKNLLLKEKH